MEKKYFVAMLIVALIMPVSVYAQVADSNEKTSQTDREKLSHALAKYNGFSTFKEGLLMVSKDNKYGFIDRAGKEVISCVYDWATTTFSESLVSVSKDDMWGFIDRTGKEVIPFVYDGAGYFSEGLAFMFKNSKVGYIDKKGKEIIPFVYDWYDDLEVSCFSEGLVSVSKDDMWGFIDRTGKEVIPFVYDWAGSFSEGLAPVLKNEKWGFVDKTGKEVIPFVYDWAGSFSEGLTPVSKDDKFGFIDRMGKEAIPFVYNDAGFFSESLAPVLKNGKWGFIDKKGSEAIPFVYEVVGKGGFSDGLACVKKNGGMWGVIDKKGKEVFPYVFSDLHSFSDGLAKVTWYGINRGDGFIDKDEYFIGQGFVENISQENEKKEVKRKEIVAEQEKTETAKVKREIDWLIGTWVANVPNFGVMRLIIHDKERYSSIAEDFGITAKGIYHVDGNLITFYTKESNAPSNLKAKKPKPYSQEINKTNQTITFSAETGDYYRKVSSSTTTSSRSSQTNSSFNKTEFYHEADFRTYIVNKTFKSLSDDLAFRLETDNNWYSVRNGAAIGPVQVTGYTKTKVSFTVNSYLGNPIKFTFTLPNTLVDHEGRVYKMQ
jgi:hypothetical protein